MKLSLFEKPDTGQVSRFLQEAADLPKQGGESPGKDGGIRSQIFNMQEPEVLERGHWEGEHRVVCLLEG